MPTFELFEEDRGGIRVLAPVGDVDARAAAALHKRLLGCLAEGRRSLLLDLSRLDSIAGDGLRAVAAAAARVEVEGGGLALCRPNASVSRVIEMAGMDRTLSVHADPAAAGDWLVQTVRRERMARLAARLLQPRRRQPRQRYRAEWVDPERAALAARLLGRPRSVAVPPAAAAEEGRG
jgi:anti-anti-sigma factor